MTQSYRLGNIYLKLNLKFNLITVNIGGAETEPEQLFSRKSDNGEHTASIFLGGGERKE